MILKACLPKLVSTDTVHRYLLSWKNLGILEDCSFSDIVIYPDFNDYFNAPFDKNKKNIIIFHAFSSPEDVEKIGFLDPENIKLIIAITENHKKILKLNIKKPIPIEVVSYIFPDIFVDRKPWDEREHKFIYCSRLFPSKLSLSSLYS